MNKRSPEPIAIEVLVSGISRERGDQLFDRDYAGAEGEKVGAIIADMQAAGLVKQANELEELVLDWCRGLAREAHAKGVIDALSLQAGLSAAGAAGVWPESSEASQAATLALLQRVG